MRKEQSQPEHSIGRFAGGPMMAHFKIFIRRAFFQMFRYLPGSLFFLQHLISNYYLLTNRRYRNTIYIVKDI